jgi:ankyrin repeat protein
VGLNRETALIRAAEAGKTSTVKLLIDMGADLRHTSVFGDTALDYAVKARNAEMASLLQQGYPNARRQ